MSQETEFIGVFYEPDQMAYRATAQTEGVSYEDYFGDAESAALARDLAILVKGMDVPRNFSLDQHELCARILELMSEREQMGLPGSFAWLEKIGLAEPEFLSAAVG